jgi:hypothetical protein
LPLPYVSGGRPEGNGALGKRDIASGEKFYVDANGNTVIVK